ncbi:polysaccharide deacetylase family protein [Dawidia soli]|uniref:Polysaccharide deacetylase family protein n=1 Tax=Dawidia soli TaxID=2782352 RepID=A0AAP2D3Y2_9BACT|nr:polysaccharide deacetylase family protein [Dawidia soli]MBT1684924.1 polysaccharide deacetylase family protein [Dawidia soli]
MTPTSWTRLTFTRTNVVARRIPRPLFCLPFLIVLLACTSTAEKQPGSGPRKDIVCFVYHRVGDSRYPTTNVSTKDFEAHLAYLAKNKFQVLSFSDAIDYLQSDAPPQKTAVITVDDGYTSFFRNGLPLLKKYNMPATLFINTRTVGGGDYMDWEQLQTALAGGMEIGNHTHSHDYFLNQGADSRYETFRQEIIQSQDIIEKHLNKKPVVFSYPYGEFDDKMKQTVKDLGFKAAAAQLSGVLYNGTDLFMCPRFPMAEAYAAKFAEKAAMRALDVTTPSAPRALPDKRPALTLTFKGKDIQTKRLQCFAQGSPCSCRITRQDTTGLITVSLQAGAAIAGRRRTLYTLTAPGKNGGWYWYSHLWINTKVK